MYRADARHTGRGRTRGPRNDRVKWTLPMVGTNGGWNYSPVIGPDGTIYVATQVTGLMAIAPDGNVKWRFDGTPSRGFVSTPAVDNGGSVYFSDGAGTLHAVDTASGAERWRTEQCGGLGVTLGNDGSLYVGNAAVDSATGAVRWRVTPTNNTTSVPALSDDCTVYVTAGSYLFAVDHQSGAIRWMSEEPVEAVADSPAIADDGTVFIGGSDGDLLALDGATGKTRWKRSTSWQIRADVGIGAEGTIYFSSEALPDRPLSALDPATGAVRWSFPVARYSSASSVAIDAEGLLYFGTGSFVRMYVLDGTSGNERFTARITTDSRKSPILGPEGTAYVWGDRTLTALGP